MQREGNRNTAKAFPEEKRAVRYTAVHDSHLSQGPMQDQQPKNVKDHKHLASEYQEGLKAS